MGCTSSTPAGRTACPRKSHSHRSRSGAASFHSIGGQAEQQERLDESAESPADRRRRLRGERHHPSTPTRRVGGGRPPRAHSGSITAAATTGDASDPAATKSHGASASNTNTSLNASRNPLTQPTDDADELASAASSTDAHALPRTEELGDHSRQPHQQRITNSSTSPSQSLSTSRRQARQHAQGSDDNYVPNSPPMAAGAAAKNNNTNGDDGGGIACRPGEGGPLARSLPATPASLRYPSVPASPAPNRSLGDLPGQPHRPPPVTRQASSGRSFLTASGFFSTSAEAALIN